jgi:hypothetical protein
MTGFEETVHAAEIMQAADSVLNHLLPDHPEIYTGFLNQLKREGAVQIHIRAKEVKGTNSFGEGVLDYEYRLIGSSHRPIIQKYGPEPIRRLRIPSFDPDLYKPQPPHYRYKRLLEKARNRVLEAQRSGLPQSQIALLEQQLDQEIRAQQLQQQGLKYPASNLKNSF